MSHPEGYIKQGEENKVCLLKKSHGLKQSPRQWYLHFDEFMFKSGYVRSAYDNVCITDGLEVELKYFYCCIRMTY